MPTSDDLEFRAVPLKPDIWTARQIGMTYTIFTSPSGFVVHCGRCEAGHTGDTPMEGAPRGLHPSFAAAVAACTAHYQRLVG